MGCCIKCSNDSNDSMSFEVMKVSHFKDRNPSGKGLVLVQKLLGFEEMSVCSSCIDGKLAQINNPWSLFIDKFKTTIFTLIVGVALLVYSWGTKDAALFVGVFCVVFFFVKLWRFLKAGYKKKDSFSRFSENNARFVAAWECLSEVAPRKDGEGHGVFYIPITKATYDMSAEDFSRYYRLTDENAEQLHRILDKRRNRISKD